jgi:wyosine [tRNA(Phe)-imidazoG37] synthetase (radical SAM superfamily)
MNNEELLKENQLLKEEIELLKIKLKNYTAPKRSKKFYESHKEEIKQKVKEYKEKTNYNNNITKEKKKEYNKIAYLKKKEKLEKDKMEKDSTIII